MNCLHYVERYRVETSRSVVAVAIRADLGHDGEMAADATGAEWTTDPAMAHRFALDWSPNLGGCPLNAPGDWPDAPIYVRVGYGDSLYDLATPQPAELRGFTPDPKPEPEPAYGPIVLDESAATFTGAWSLWVNQGMGGSVREGRPGDSAEWSLPAVPGRYRVEATWTANPNRNDRARYAVASGGKPLGYAIVNQQIAPSGAFVGVTPWQAIGEFDARGPAVSVTLTGEGEGRLNADAVRITWLGPLVPADPSAS